MNEHPLRLLQAVLDANPDDNGRHLQLATRDTNGHPACRTVVFRHLDVDAGCLYCITDFRSHKAEEIRLDPRVEVCWYLHGTREQFRLRGAARLLGEDADASRLALRRTIWDRLSADARRLFAAPAPGTPLDPGAGAPPAPAEPPACFALLELTVEGVDHLDLTTEPHQRTLFRSEDNRWRNQALNP